ncbi:hypothetical protein JCM10213_005882 [Rhodosporidiobolus nylandii]
MTTILILGGLGQDATRHILPYLTSASSACPADQRPAFVRVVDKYLAIPAAGAYTTYVDGLAREALKKGTEDGTIEYLQGNLLTEATREKAFTLPEKFGGPGKGFSYVLDFTGETDFNLPEVVHLERTLRLALLLGQDAVKHKVGAYLRLLQPFYKLKEEKKGGKVGAKGAAPAEPWGTMAGWWHEAARGLAKMDGLNLVLLRPALFYGPFTVTGMTPRVLIGEVYRFQKEKMEFLWAESLPQNTIHATDFASACLSAVSWAFKQGSRSSTLALHSEPLPSTLSSNAQIESVAAVGAAKKEDECRAAVFNAVDDGETTQKEVAKIVEDVVGVKSGFHGSIISSFAKLNMSDVVEDVNDKHLEGWSALLQASNPPLSTTVPISPAVPLDLLAPNPLSFDNSALRELTGWAPKHKLDKKTVRETVEGFRKEGLWPNAEPQKKK